MTIQIEDRDTTEDRVCLQALLAAIAAGDRGAFAELYDRTSARVYGVARRVLVDPGYAEETTQEVYLQVWRSAGTFNAEHGSVMTWLSTLAHHRAVDRVRSEQSTTQRESIYGTRNWPGVYDPVSEEVLEKIERRAVRDGLGILSSVQQEALLLAYYGGLTYREVAAHLGVALPTVKTRIRDALIRLHASLAPA